MAIEQASSMIIQFINFLPDCTGIIIMAAQTIVILYWYVWKTHAFSLIISKFLLAKKWTSYFDCFVFVYKLVISPSTIIILNISHMPSLFIEVQNLAHNKRIRVQTLFTIINQLVAEESQLSLAQKSAIIQTISRSFLVTTKNWLTELKRLKLEICNTPAPKSGNTKHKSSQAQRREKIRTKQVLKNLSIDQILDQVMGQNISVDSMMAPTPKRDSILPDNKFMVTIPPFDPETIAQMSQDISSAMQTMKKIKEVGQFDVGPKMVSYKKWLALTQQNIDITHEKKKATVKTKKRTGQKVILVDQKIDISQGIDRLQQLQILKTKVKLSRQLSDTQSLKFIQKQIQQFSPVLTVDPLTLVEKIKKIGLLNKKESTPVKSNDNLINLNYVMEQFDLNDQAYERSTEMFVNEANDATLTAKLQERITKIVNNELFKEPKVSLNSLCRDRNISKQLKGEMFYQLLHLNFKLDQPAIHQFGDIYITAN